MHEMGDSEMALQVKKPASKSKHSSVTPTHTPSQSSRGVEERLPQVLLTFTHMLWTRPCTDTHKIKIKYKWFLRNKGKDTRLGL